MERNRQTKVIAIIALVVAVIGMSVGFAAFSNTLTISSSATVKPTEEDFKLVAYGLGEGINKETWVANPVNLSLYTSKTSGMPLLGIDNNPAIGGEKAVISSSGDKISISNLSATFSEPEQDLFYAVALKNEGSYDAYLKITEEDIDKLRNSEVNKVCTAGDGTTESLMNAACDDIYLGMEIGKSNGDGFFNTTEGSYKIEPGDHVIIFIVIYYDKNGGRADGPFTIDFDDITLNFSTAA